MLTRDETYKLMVEDSLLEKDTCSWKRPCSTSMILKEGFHCILRSLLFTALGLTQKVTPPPVCCHSSDQRHPEAFDHFNRSAQRGNADGMLLG